LADHGLQWVEGQDPASRKGATIGWFRRYQSANGQLYAVLLTAYIFITLLPVARVAAGLSPALAERRGLLEAQASAT